MSSDRTTSRCNYCGVDIDDGRYDLNVIFVTKVYCVEDFVN